MRKAFKGRLQKCEVLAGQLRVSGVSKSHLVTTAALLSDMYTPEPRQNAQKGRPNTVVAFAVGNPHPPCTTSLQALQNMELSDVRMDTHHRGRVLTVRRVAPVVRLVTCSWTVVKEESSGEMERLEIMLRMSNHGQDILESGSTYEIKEPYFTLSDQGEPTLRIDHPSDLVVHMGSFRTDRSYCPAKDIDDSGGAVSAAPPTVLAEDIARKYKEKGNAALKQQDLLLAHANYTQGLRSVTIDGAAKEDLACDLFRNRAHVNLVLNRLDEAKSDALASLSGLEDQRHKDLDGKAFLRAGCAAHNLGEFHEAERFFEEYQRLAPGNEDATARVRKTQLRLKEQATGVYNFNKIKAGLAMARPRVDAASFTHNVTVGESLGRGRGLFATRDIDAGEIILCEKAFCVVWGHEDEALTAMTYDNRDDRIRVFPAGLCKSIVQKLLDNPSQVAKVMNLCSNYGGIGKQLIMPDAGPVIDTFQVHDIVVRNAFGLGPAYSGEEEDVRNASIGLWIMASYANHSCVPHAEKEAIGDLMVLRARRPIRAGEEVTHSYDASSDYDARSTSLMNTWGFKCCCPLCVAEEADGPALREKRRELEGEAGAFVERETAVGAKRLSVVKARRLAKAIENTYDDERYGGLPRTALLRIQKWLVEVTTR